MGYLKSRLPMMVEVSDEMTGHALHVASCQTPLSAAASARPRRGGE